LNEIGEKYFELLDTTHKTPVVLLYPDRYDIKDIVEYFRQLLEMMTTRVLSTQILNNNFLFCNLNRGFLIKLTIFDAKNSVRYSRQKLCGIFIEKSKGIK
jgi:hypothetical protein